MATTEELHNALAVPPEDLSAARRLARRFDGVGEDVAAGLLWEDSYGSRLVGLLLLVQQFRQGTDPTRTAILEDYLAASRSGRIDSRELVDVSAEHIVGDWYVDRSRNPLFALAKSDVVWDRRIALVATLAFVKRGDATTSLDIAARLVRENSEQIQSAIGRVLREIGKRADHAALLTFLEHHGRQMSREARTWATEHLAPPERDRLRSA